MDNLSRHDLEECGGHVGFNVEHTGMGAAARGVGCSNFFSVCLEGGCSSSSSSSPWQRVVDPNWDSLTMITPPADEVLPMSLMVKGTTATRKKAGTPLRWVDLQLVR